ncbi:MAG: MotA/TolQ/ExbB proton channel family protein [Bryobacterales bacterium]|nr:MotA/TolQ/ExbB proton channel family protein [Bryobacterales bacterium]MDE0260903.1 MotA/TolQ/ExbB proton channel family protein [Bryobacterales bacterium]MDE0624426.1 MotA/TolQ/ExbB proton channel family protein [Bryobacterales bacterium]
MEQLQSLLYWISSAFLLPAMVAIVGLFVYATYLAGGVLAESFDRRANRDALRRLYEGEPSLERFLGLDWRLALGRFADGARLHPERLDKIVSDLENDLRQRADRLSVLSRTGPMLGLIGTLIPLQPALAGLAAGDMQSMASNLLIGFTTTVVGLIVGGAAFALGVQVRYWGRQDLTEMHYLMEVWSAGTGREEAPDA